MFATATICVAFLIGPKTPLLGFGTMGESISYHPLAGSHLESVISTTHHDLFSTRKIQIKLFRHGCEILQRHE